MTNSPSYIITDSSIAIVVNGTPYNVNHSNPKYEELKNLIASQNFSRLEDILNPNANIAVTASFTRGNLVVKGGEVFYKGQAVHNYVVTKIKEFMKSGLPFQPLLNFLENLLQNPSFRAVEELYGFLEYAKLPITEDGHFLAYRKVTEDYKDFYTKTFDNSVGKTVEVPRNHVDENSNKTCSNGLHFCSQAYLSQYHGGKGRVVIVKINPADVVCIPTDYNNTKGRCCKYLVFGDCSGYEAGEKFGALYQTEPTVAFNDGSDYDSDGANSRALGYKEGVYDAKDGVVRDASQALADIQDGNINDFSFAEGYNEGYSSVYAEVKQAKAPVAKVVKKTTISPATRAKLRKAAKRQKRDGNGKFI